MEPLILYITFFLLPVAFLLGYGVAFCIFRDKPKSKCKNTL